MIARLSIFAILILTACKEPSTGMQTLEATENAATLAIRSLIDPAKLDTLAARGASPRLRKAMYWLSQSKRPADAIDDAQKCLRYATPARARAVKESLLRNFDILEKLGCLDAENLAKLRRGRAPVITKGPYAGEIAEVDHIIPFSVVPELGNRLYNLEFMPESLNRAKGAKMGERQRQLAEKWRREGLL